MPTKVVICGVSGRMGQTLSSLIEQRDDFDLVGGIDRDQPATTDIVSAADVIIDFIPGK